MKIKTFKSPRRLIRNTIFGVLALSSGLFFSWFSNPILNLPSSRPSVSVVNAVPGGVATCAAEEAGARYVWQIRGVSESYSPGSAASGQGAIYTGEFEISLQDYTTVPVDTVLNLDVLRFFCPLNVGQSGTGDPTPGTCSIWYYVHTLTGKRVFYGDLTTHPAVSFERGAPATKRISVAVENAPPMCGSYQIDVGFSSGNGIVINNTSHECDPIQTGNLAHATCTSSNGCSALGFTGNTCFISSICPAGTLTYVLNDSTIVLNVSNNPFVHTPNRPEILFRKIVNGQPSEWISCQNHFSNNLNCYIDASYYSGFRPGDKIEAKVDTHIIKNDRGQLTSLNRCVRADNGQSQWIPNTNSNQEYFLGQCSNDCTIFIEPQLPTNTPTPTPTGTPVPTATPTPTPTPTGTPVPTATPTPTPTPTGTPVPTATPTPTPTPTGTPVPTATPTPTPTPTGTPVPTATPTPTPSPTVTPTGTPRPTNTPTPTATLTPTPVPQCNSTCARNDQCPSNLFCFIPSGFSEGRCRLPSNASDEQCRPVAPTATPTPTATPSPTNTPIPSPTRAVVYHKGQPIPPHEPLNTGTEAGSMVAAVSMILTGVGWIIRQRLIGV